MTVSFQNVFIYILKYVYIYMIRDKIRSMYVCNKYIIPTMHNDRLKMKTQINPIMKKSKTNKKKVLCLKH